MRARPFILRRTTFFHFQVGGVSRPLIIVRPFHAVIFLSDSFFAGARRIGRATHAARITANSNASVRATETSFMIWVRVGALSKTVTLVALRRGQCGQVSFSLGAPARRYFHFNPQPSRQHWHIAFVIERTRILQNVERAVERDDVNGRASGASQVVVSCFVTAIGFPARICSKSKPTSCSRFKRLP